MTSSEIANRLVTITEEDGWLYVRCAGRESMSVCPERRYLAEARAAELRAEIESRLL